MTLWRTKFSILNVNIWTWNAKFIKSFLFPTSWKRQGTINSGDEVEGVTIYFMGTNTHNHEWSSPPLTLDVCEKVVVRFSSLSNNTWTSCKPYTILDLVSGYIFRASSRWIEPVLFCALYRFYPVKNVCRHRTEAPWKTKVLLKCATFTWSVYFNQFVFS